MIVSEQIADQTSCWQLEALPGDGLIATASHHLLVVEVDDDIASSGLADEIVTIYDAHSRLLGRGAARSLRLAVSAVLAERETTACAVALVSVWDDKLAVYLHGRAEATLLSGRDVTTLSGQDSLVATDVVLSNEFDELVLHVGERPDDDRAPLEPGQITTGRGVRLMLQRHCTSADPLNTWGAQR